MPALAEFLRPAAQKGELVNILFEERLFELISLLHRITGLLVAGQIPQQVVGELAVLIHVEEASPEHSPLTRDIDLMVRRDDLERVKLAAAKGGFRFCHTSGVDVLLYGAVGTGRNSIHLVSGGEKVFPSYPAPSPDINPVIKVVDGKEVRVIAVADLLRMKLTANRRKDQVHVKALDAAGLITPELENRLMPELAARLKRVRETE